MRCHLKKKIGSNCPSSEGFDENKISRFNMCVSVLWMTFGL
jgi:hypothetical protein